MLEGRVPQALFDLRHLSQTASGAPRSEHQQELPSRSSTPASRCTLGIASSTIPRVIPCASIRWQASSTAGRAAISAFVQALEMTIPEYLEDGTKRWSGKTLDVLLLHLPGLRKIMVYYLGIDEWPVFSLTWLYVQVTSRD